MVVELSKTRRKIIFGIMFWGTFLTALSQSMMISALPTIMGQFHVDAALGQLLTTSYIFALGLIAALTAFLINRVNTKLLFILAMASFVIGCVATLFAPNYWWLLASRLFQAGGGGIAMPLAQVMALSLYPKEEYGRAMGIIGLIIGFAPAVGPAISGIIIDAWSWKMIFVLLGSLVTIIAILALIFFQDVADHDPNEHFDPLSNLLYLAGAISFMVGVTSVESHGYWVPQSYFPAAVGLVLLVLFARRQLRLEHPLLKLSLFKNRSFAVSAGLVIISQIAFMLGAIMVPLFVQDIMHRSATISGLIILPGAIFLGFCNPITGRLLDRYGVRPLIIAGTLITTLGTLAFTLPIKDAPDWLITVLYGVRMMGIACLMMPMTAYGSACLPKEDLAQASAIFTSFRQLMGSVVASILIAVMSYNSAGPLGVDAHGFDVSFTIQAAIVGIFGMLALFFMPKGDGRISSEDSCPIHQARLKTCPSLHH